MDQLSLRELNAVKQNTTTQITKLRQALESLKESTVQHSLKQAAVGSVPEESLSLLMQQSHNFSSSSSAASLSLLQSTNDKILEAKQYMGAIALLLNDFEQQREAVNIELKRRDEQKQTQRLTEVMQKSQDLDSRVARDMERHVGNAAATRYEVVSQVQQLNRRHENRVVNIRKQVNEQRMQAVVNMKNAEKKESERQAARQKQLEADQEQRRIRAESRHAKLAEKLEAFDKARMQGLDTSGPRKAGDTVRDLISQQHEMHAGDSKRSVKGSRVTSQLTTRPQSRDAVTDSVAKKGTNAPAAAVANPPADPFSPGVLERLTKPPPRGIQLKDVLDQALDSHVAQAERAKQYTTLEVREKRERREKVISNNLQKLGEAQESWWNESRKRQEEEEKRMSTLRAAQTDALQQLTSQRESVRRLAAMRAEAASVTPTVDTWASRARLLIEAACKSAMLSPAELVRAKSVPLVQHGESSGALDKPRKGFEAKSDVVPFPHASSHS